MVLSFLKDLSSKWNFPYACPKRADSETVPAKLNKKTNVFFTSQGLCSFLVSRYKEKHLGIS